MKETLIALVVASALVGCAQKPYVIQNTYDPSEYQWSNAKGTASILGQAFMRTVGGDVKTCAGAPVFLVPDTRYVEEIVRAGAEGKTLPPHEQLSSFAKQTLCTLDGSFEFRDLAAGRWFVYTAVSWKAPAINLFGDPYLQEQGGIIFTAVNLTDGQSLKVPITR